MFLDNFCGIRWINDSSVFSNSVSLVPIDFPDLALSYCPKYFAFACSFGGPENTLKRCATNCPRRFKCSFDHYVKLINWTNAEVLQL
jgi:hypothetical protein